MKDWFLGLLWKGLPKKGMSRMVGGFSKRPLSRKLIPHYIKHFEIDMTPVKKELHEFDSLLDFFVREYKEEARPIDVREGVWISPVDGTISEIGDIKDGTLIQAKGVRYSLEELLGGNQTYVEKFKGGKFATIYLSPKDYHRIHMPVTGHIQELTYIPGELYPVNEWGVRLVPSLFARNERVISYIHLPEGYAALIKVGATNVGSIKVTFDDKIVTNPKKKCGITHKRYKKPPALNKGMELGRFEFGSTVILLFEPNMVEWCIEAKPGTKVKMGQPFARMICRKKD